MPDEFVHLRLHTEYSMRDGLLRIPDLLERVKKNGMSAVAISDHSNLCGMVKFYERALSKKLKPIIAADVMIHEGDERFLATFYCQNEQGYRHLTWLLSEAYLKGQDANGDPLIHWEWLAGHTEGLIVLSGGCFGDVGKALLAKKIELAKQRLERWLLLFPDRFYLEITRTKRPQEEWYIKAAVALSSEYDVPMVATNDVRFLDRDDFEAHEARVCIHDSVVLDAPNRLRRYSEEQYLKSPAEMIALFADLPEAIENTLELAKRCTCAITLGEVFLPQIPVPEGFTIGSYLKLLSSQGLSSYLDKCGVNEPDQRKRYEDRLALELSVIIEMGFSGYFLIVADFIGWAKKNKIPVGPGRGSGAGSLVAFALCITALDPLEHDLLFERFLNPERVSMPDFDIDFCMERRDLVIDYVTTRYGRDCVSQIITYGTMAARAVLRDVGRVLGQPYGFCDKLAKLIPFEVGMTLEKAFLQEEELARRYREEADVATLIDLAKKLEGITRNAGKHAGGVVIAPGRLTDFTPLYCEADGSNLVTQFDKDDVEAVGLVKFDFLGLRTLTIIDWALQTINADIDIDAIPTDDELVFKLLQHCETTAVFQLESRGMKELVKRLQPDCFDDITALVALFRPGPLQSGMVDDYVDRKHGRAPVYYPHPDIESILKPTYGVILYQEQVMQIAQVLAGYTLGAADLLRRAMGKKNAEEMAKQRSIFVEGSTKRGIDASIAEHIFDLMEKFAGYGFNKSHSAAYAVLTYQTAWLKAHYPAEFMAAVLSSDMDNTDKIVSLIVECERMRLRVLSPDINCDHYMFTVNKEGCIVYGLGAVKGVGQSAAVHIVEERLSGGPYANFYEFCCRVDLHKVNRRVLEALIKCGAFDVLGDRATLFASLDRGVQAAEQQTKRALVGQVDLFADSDAMDMQNDLAYVTVPAWPLQTQLQYEKEVLGRYVSGHPFKVYEKELSSLLSCQIAALSGLSNREATIAGILLSQRGIITKSGRRMAILKLEDSTGFIEVTVFSRLLEEVRDFLEDDAVLIVKGKIEDDQFTGGLRMVAEQILTLDAYRNAHVKKLVLLVKGAESGRLLEKLPLLIKNYLGGNCPIVIQYEGDGAHAQLALGDEWKVSVSQNLLLELEQICGKDHVSIGY